MQNTQFTQSTVQGLQFTVQSWQSTVYNSESTVHSSECTVQSSQLRVHSAQSTVHSAQCTQCTSEPDPQCRARPSCGLSSSWNGTTTNIITTDKVMFHQYYYPFSIFTQPNSTVSQYLLSITPILQLCPKSQCSYSHLLGYRCSGRLDGLSMPWKRTITNITRVDMFNKFLLKSSQSWPMFRLLWGTVVFCIKLPDSSDTKLLAISLLHFHHCYRHRHHPSHQCPHHVKSFNLPNLPNCVTYWCHLQNYKKNSRH